MWNLFYCRQLVLSRRVMWIDSDWWPHRCCLNHLLLQPVCSHLHSVGEVFLFYNQRYLLHCSPLPDVLDAMVSVVPLINTWSLIACLQNEANLQLFDSDTACMWDGLAVCSVTTETPHCYKCHATFVKCHSLLHSLKREGNRKGKEIVWIHPLDGRRLNSYGIQRSRTLRFQRWQIFSGQSFDAMSQYDNLILWFCVRESFVSI